MTDPLAPAALEEWERLARAAKMGSWWLPASALLHDGFHPDSAAFIAWCSPERILGLIAAAQKGAEDSARLDHLDSLPSGITLNSDARFPSCSMTPKEGGFSHTRKLIDMDRIARRAAPEERDDATAQHEG